MAIQVFPGVEHESAVEVQPVPSPKESHMRLEIPYSSLQAARLVGADIGRIRNDQIETSMVAKESRQVSTDQLDAITTPQARQLLLVNLRAGK